MAQRVDVVTTQIDVEDVRLEGYKDDLLTVHEVARQLRVDDTTVRRWINNGILEAITLPHSGKRRGYRIKQSTLDELLRGPGLPRE